MGIHFDKYGLVYTDPMAELGEKHIPGYNGFSIEIAFKPESDHTDGFNFLFNTHAGNDRTQLLVAQYHTWIVIMNGDDYNHKRKTKRISLNIASQNPAKTFLTITSGAGGTHVYVDGQMVRAEKNLRLKLPDGGRPRFVLGNSVYGHQSWTGEVYGFAFYERVLAAKNVKSHVHSWSQEQNFLFAKKAQPAILYLFDEQEGERVIDHGSGHNDLKVPPRTHVLLERILALPGSGFELNATMLQDILLNLAGFIPLGFFLAATLLQNNRFSNQQAVLIAVIFCFAVSLMMEVYQAWIPSRSSQMMDLVFNTLGALIGAKGFITVKSKTRIFD